MSLIGYLQIIAIFILLLAVTPAYGRFMAKVFKREKTWLDIIFSKPEKTIYWLCAVNPKQEQHWSVYLFSLVIFSLVSFVFIILILTLQNLLPLNPENFNGVSLMVALNTAVSFITNTNWQVYAGESALSYFSQSVALTVQNFLSAAVGIAVAIAFIRAFAREGAKTIGNFWVDVTRAVFWVLIPLCIFITPILIWQGVPQNIDAYVNAETVLGSTQKIPMGPVASQMAIKHLGTNGGGFFNANAAHPFENPTALTNLIYIISIVFIGISLTHTFGIMVGDRSQGYAILTVMLVLLISSVVTIYYSESQPINGFEGGNMEGKELRFGISGSSIFSSFTTATSAGAVNAMHDSFTPIAGLAMKLNMMLGEIIVGGVGSGFYGMLIFVIITVFTAGLMVGRTPEYIGKKIEIREIKFAMLAMLIAPVGIILFSSLVVLVPDAASSISNPGPHGLSQILYNYSSVVGNNGSGFAGFNAATNLHMVLSTIAMIIGRFVLIVAVLAIAGSIAEKRKIPVSICTMPTNSTVFVVLLTTVILIIGGLTFIPALILGPIAEHILILTGKTF